MLIKSQPKVQIKFKKLHPDAIIPQYQTEGASGFDLHALITDEVPSGVPGSDSYPSLSLGRIDFVHSGEVAIIRTGLAVAIPKGYELQVRSRSGLAAKSGVFVVNSPGTVDSDYRGEIKIILSCNKTGTSLTVNHGDRIAQGVIVPVPACEIIEVEELDSTARGSGGFGSTGSK